MNCRLVAALVLTLGALTACGRSTPAQTAGDDYRLFLAEGYGDGPPIMVRDSATGKLERELPLGVAAPDWSRYYTISAGLTSRLSAIDPASGRTLAQLTIPAGFSLPTLTYPQLPGGLSPDGSWLVLSMQSTVNATLHSEFLVGPTSLTKPFSRLSLNGDFTFDAIGNDGTSLYLIETMGDPGHYRVRLYDVPHRVLTPQPVVDKREPNEPMNGIRGDSLASPDGRYVFTIYARDSGPFIHALPLGQPYAWCVDLPSSQASNVEEQFEWSLAGNRDGSSLYAVNGVSGRIAEITPAKLPELRRTSQLSSASANIALPSSGGGSGPAGPREPRLGAMRAFEAFGWGLSLVTGADAKGVHVGGAALSPDGRTLFALDNAGIVAIDTATLRVRARYLGGGAVMSIRLSTDGRWLFAADVEHEQIVKLDPQTGKVAGQIAALTASPWAILWAEPK